MADDIDKANDLADLHLEAALANVRITGNENLTGKCQWCGEPTGGAFCGAPCRTDFNKHQRMKS